MLFSWNLPRQRAHYIIRRVILALNAIEPPPVNRIIFLLLHAGTYSEISLDPFLMCIHSVEMQFYSQSAEDAKEQKEEAVGSRIPNCIYSMPLEVFSSIDLQWN